MSRGLMRFFDRIKGEKLVLAPSGNAALVHGGAFHVPAWERRPMPDLAGALAYAYEGVALPPYPQFGGGQMVQGRLPYVMKPMVSQPAALPYAPGPATGTIYTQPLYNPKGTKT